MRALAAAVGPFETRNLQFRSTELLTNLLLRKTLLGLQPRRSDALQPPWPDLVITAGRRNEPVARWIRQASGQRTKLVHIGRPWSRPANFDLIVTTPQYFVPMADNVLMLTLPLHGLTPAALAAGAAAWLPALQHLPRPWTAVLVGGNSGPYRFTAARATRFAQLLLEHRGHGSLLVSTSGRTPHASVAALRAGLAGHPQHFYNWHQDRQVANPYAAYLGLADDFVVTAESASMLAEACSTGKHVAMFDLAGPPREPLGGLYWKPLTFVIAQRLAPTRFRRDVSQLHKRLLATGQVDWLGMEQRPQRGLTAQDTDKQAKRPAPQTTSMSAAQELAQAAARVSALLDQQ